MHCLFFTLIHIQGIKSKKLLLIPILRLKVLGGSLDWILWSGVSWTQPSDPLNLTQNQYILLTHSPLMWPNGWNQSFVLTVDPSVPTLQFSPFVLTCNDYKHFHFLPWICIWIFQLSAQHDRPLITPFQLKQLPFCYFRLARSNNLTVSQSDFCKYSPSVCKKKSIVAVVRS